MNEIDRQLEIIREGSVDFFGEEELRDRLATALRVKRPLRVKLGMDPSAPDLHLGHTVVLRKLRAFQDLGHTPIFLVGDFTARIGDPSGKNKTRPPLDEDTVRENASTYVEQVAQLLDVERAEVRFNSEWMSQLSPADFVRLCSHYTVARLLERDDFSKRYAAQAPIAVHEFLYPFVQAYDSVALRSDVELGGTDQTFNLLMAREIQRNYDQPAQAVITHPLLVGADGRKMSKSLGNHIGILEAPEDVYGKLMSIPDALLAEYAILLAAPEDLRGRCAAAGEGSGDPMGAKQALAAHVVDVLRGAEEANRAADHFHRVVQRKEVPDDVETTPVDLSGADRLALIELLERLTLVKSRSEARRLIAQGGVQVDGSRVEDATLELEPGTYLIQVGKRRFARVELRG